ncbi:unnamed protein product, partial [Didymodactylos carnosus]
PGLRCRFTGHCEVTITSRRHCTYCRLQKCFTVGMRKEWIQSEEEKNRRKYQSEKNRQLKEMKHNNNGKIIHTLSLLSNDKSNLTQDDWRHLNNIIISHEQNVKPIVFNRHSIKTTTVNDFVNNKTVWVQQLSSYFKHIPEFQQLNANDQILLFKYNFFTLVPINIVLIKRILAPVLPPCNADHTSFMISIHGEELYRKMRENIHMISLFQHDPVIIKLMLIIVLFSGCLLTTTSQIETNCIQNMSQIYEAQNFYAKLLWNYMEYTFGEFEAISTFTMLVTRCLRIQEVSNETASCLKRQLNLNSITPLMQSVLQLN